LDEDDVDNCYSEKTKKEYLPNHIVEKFLDSIVADDTSIGKGTDNMTCILVRVKW